MANTKATKDDFSINFSGQIHDHSLSMRGQQQVATDTMEDQCSTIAILRRNPMYDCLVLVKKFRRCLGGYSLEFPLERIGSQATDQQQQHLETCTRRRLISKFLDGDDPMYQSCCINNGTATSQLSATMEPSAVGHRAIVGPFEVQLDDEGNKCELVHVPINGLLDRLKNYTESGVAVDSRVYAFAMGLKTAERILTTNSMKELQETPI